MAKIPVLTQPIIVGDCALIPLRGRGLGQYAIVDLCDVDTVKQYNWFMHHTGYPYMNVRPRIAGRMSMMSMHNLLIPPTRGFHTDHINRLKLDNRRVNLRVCTPRENALNRKTFDRKRKNPYKGVSRHHNSWRASLTIEGVRHDWHHFPTPEMAHEHLSEMRRRVGIIG